ncbi:SigE family RNA polymerase sigma factor [Streptomyces sparsogenes]|uniref:RNA polymerase sigma factor n=1 Tax=Streptomyces sparsogenes TaxID=67365 RepID=UPI003322320C
MSETAGAAASGGDCEKRDDPGVLEDFEQAEQSEQAEEFEEFYARTYPWLAARAVMLSGNRQNAEDAVQEAFIEAMRRWPTVRACASPEGWVATTMRRKLSRDGRRWWYRWKPTELTVPAAASASVEETSEALAALRALGMLPPRQRQVVVMHSLEGMSYAEIGAELGISAGSVGSNLHKARARLSLLLDVSPELGRPGESLFPGVRTDPLSTALRGAAAWLMDGLRASPPVPPLPPPVPPLPPDERGGRRGREADRGGGRDWLDGRGGRRGREAGRGRR